MPGKRMAPAIRAGVVLVALFVHAGPALAQAAPATTRQAAIAPGMTEQQ